MGSIIRVNHPNLTPEERTKRMKQVRESAIRFYKEVHAQRRNKYEEKSKNRIS